MKNILLDYVTVCVDYVDFLEVSFKHNKDNFDRFTVVTSLSDKNTTLFCKSNNINVFETDIFYANGAKFNCGAGINYGLSKIASTAGWALRMDCDTFVPDNFKNKLPELNTDFFYGARRVLLNTSEDYSKFLIYKRDEDFEIPYGIGYGFFQMFHFSSSPMKNKPFGYWYPSYPICDEVDWMFRNQWGDHYPHDFTRWHGKLDILPFNVYHLGPHGQNHFGRKSEKFIIS